MLTHFQIIFITFEQLLDQVDDCVARVLFHEVRLLAAHPTNPGSRL